MASYRPADDGGRSADRNTDPASRHHEATMATHAKHGPFHIGLTSRSSLGRPFAAAAGSAAERLLGFTRLNQMYAHLRILPGDSFFERALAELQIALEVDAADLLHIPATGPLVLTCNHPFGALDGVILAALVQRVRPDFRFLANFLLGRIPELREILFAVDPFERPGSAGSNLGALREAIRWVGEGGALGVFPSGEVSSLSLRTRTVTDRPWSDAVARIVKRTDATVVPVYFDGRNSRFFQFCGLLHPRLRTALLPRELLNKQRARVAVCIGNPITPQKLSRFDSSESMTQYLRLRTYILRGRCGVGGGAAPAEPPAGLANPAPVVAAEPAEKLAVELLELPPDKLLVESGAFRVYCARGEEIPLMLREIGRLREVTFRAAGEGTGREIDLDHFDPYYLHLFVWNAERRELVGAYRLGPTDDVIARRGVSGLYTRTLFDFSETLLREVGPAYELGRSFITAGYQRTHSPLMLLWKGIGRLVATQPRYRMLFGAVSIANDYRSMTKQLLMTFLKVSGYESDLTRFVKPKNPPKLRPMRDFDSRLVSTVVGGLDEVDELVTEIESSQRAMPVLLRQYLKLNARLLGFNIDPDFGDVLDGLVLVDLTKVDRPVLARYLGRESAATFLAHHGISLRGDG
jgi:putative hemolysin